MATDSPSERRVRVRVAVVIVYGSVGALAFLIRPELYEYFGVDPGFALVVSLVLLVAAAAGILGLYLRGDVNMSAFGSSSRIPDSDGVFMSGELHDLRTELFYLKTRLAAIAVPEVGVAGDRTELVKRVSESIAPDIATELAQRFAADAATASHIGLARDVFTATHARLRQQIESLNRRANLNLIIGVLTTLLAVGLLAYMVLTVSGSFVDMTSLMSYYVPRVATGVFIEVFSFFFLRLYKSNLAEVQYYQDQLTKLAAQQIALEAAHARPDIPTISAVVQSLAKGHDGAVVAPRVNGAGEQLKPLTDLLQQVAKLVGDLAKTK